MEDDVPCELLKIPREIVIILLTSIELSSDLLSRIYNLTRNRCKDIEMLCFGFFQFYSLILWKKKKPNYWTIIEISIFKAVC